ncbi:hypothetical protein LTR85_002001 [Meristemomyces frigidus]|nr:hypothetical protein LTR85_002001 [Meristemomyces frigidus]
MSTLGPSKSESGDSKSAFTPSSGHSEPEQSLEGLQPQPVEAEQAANSSAMPLNPAKAQDEINSQVTAQIQDLVTITANLREQLTTQIQANEQLKAELAASRAENARSLAACESKLDAVSETVKLQTSAFVAQQGHVDNLDKSLSLRLGALDKQVLTLQESAREGSETEATGSTDDTANAIAKLRQHMHGLELARNKTKLAHTIVAATRRNVRDTMFYISAMIKASADKKSCEAYEAAVSHQIDSSVQRLLGRGASEADGQRMRNALEDAYKLDVTALKDFVDSLKGACGAAGEHGKSAATQASVDEQVCQHGTSILANEHSHGLAKAAETSPEEQKAAVAEPKATIFDLEAQLTATTEELQQEQSAAAEETKAAIANLKSELAAITAEMRQDHDTVTKECQATVSDVKAELSATVEELRETQRIAADRAEEATAAMTDLKYTLAEAEKVRERQTTAAEEAKTTIAELKADLAALAVDVKRCNEMQEEPDAEDHPSRESMYEAIDAHSALAFTYHDGEAICNACQQPAVHYSQAGPCNHFTCWTCSLRRRALHKDKTCGTCNEEIDTVIFTDTTGLPHDSYSDENLCYTNLELGIGYQTQEIAMDTIALLGGACLLSCGIPWMESSNLDSHVRQYHKKVVCTLCTSFKKVFAHEHEVFNRHELRQHLKLAHPECGKCQRHCFDEEGLHMHDPVCGTASCRRRAKAVRG